eukprot:1939717-Prymnesium_polylepis.1
MRPALRFCAVDEMMMLCRMEVSCVHMCVCMEIHRFARVLARSCGALSARENVAALLCWWDGAEVWPVTRA